MNMRKSWFEYVAKTRKKLQRKSKTKTVSHKEAMKVASVHWPKEKAKIQRKLAREKRKITIRKEIPSAKEVDTVQVTPETSLI